MYAAFQSLLSEPFLPCLVLLLISLISLRLFPISSLRSLLTTGKESTVYSLERALASYNSYLSLSNTDISRIREGYTKLGRRHRRMAYELGYTKKLDRLGEVTRVNAGVCRAISEAYSKSLSRPIPPFLGTLTPSDLSRVREALKHFVRDWSSEGASERTTTFSPILEHLKRTVPPHQRKGKRVLIPGCGLGRLAWEVSQLGFQVHANELSGHMLLALDFLLNKETTWMANQHVIHPFSHWFSHQQSSENLFRSVSFPDEVPRRNPNFRVVEGDFFDISPEAEEGGEGYDYVITLFFIDTSLNILRTLEHIHALLRPGGKWINLGPLLYSSSSLELSLDELMTAVERTGFDIEEESRRKVEAEYTADREAMMKWVYGAEFWVADKRRED